MVIDEEQRREFMLIFNQGYEELVFPDAERREYNIRKDMKNGFSKVIKILDEMRSTLDRMDRKLDYFYGQKLK